MENRIRDRQDSERKKRNHRLQAFTQGLNVEPSDITLCGTSDTVSMADLIAALHQLSETSEIDDTLLVYFAYQDARKNTAVRCMMR